MKKPTETGVKRKEKSKYILKKRMYDNAKVPARCFARAGERLQMNLLYVKTTGR